MQCQPTVRAPSRSEPLPELTDAEMDLIFGAIVATLGEEKARKFWQWFTTDWRNWGREGWQRLDAARAQPPCT